jgi:hypothetical protein
LEENQLERPSWLIIFLLIVFFIFYNKSFFDLITKKCKISLKQRAHILSLKNSFVMSICGIFFNYYYFFSNKKFDSLYNISIIIVCSFASYLISDLIIGIKEYPSELGLLTAYIHHIIYIFVTALTIFTGTSHFLVLYFLLEIPTFILALGTMIAKYRKDHLFGHLFFALRIVFHILLLYLFRKNILLTSLSGLALCLHMYWFKNWYQKYVTKN